MRLARILLCVHSLFLFALVPLARRLEGFFNRVVLSSRPGQAFALLIAVLSLVLILRLFWKRARKFNHSKITLLIYLGLLLALSLSISSFCIVPAEFAHLPLYALLGIFAWNSLPGCGFFKRSGYSLLIVALIGLIDELLQGLHPQRFFDWRDLALNTSGGILGLLFIFPMHYGIRPIPFLRFFTFLRQRPPGSSHQG